MISTNKKTIITISLLFMMWSLSLSQSCNADVEWTFGRQLTLDSSPLDIASSIDGLWVYILNPGEVALYSILDNRVVNRIPVDKTFDRISFSSQNNTLFVSNSTTKTITLIQLEVLHKFSLDGLAFKGLENAPVTIAVFSDYQ